MRKEFLFILPFYFLVTLFFFYPVLKGQIPFAGDLLVSYPPYSSQGYLGYAPGGVPNKAQGQDSIRESYPWKYFTIRSFKNGQIPFWTPYNFSGNPIMADFQSAVFYPLNLIFFAVPFTAGWTVLMFLSPFLASIFAYMYLREIGLSKTAGFFGGFVFGFSSYMTVQLEWGNVTHTFLWLPLVLFFTEKLTKRTSLPNAIGLIISLWFCFLAGYIQSYFYILIISGSYFVAKTLYSQSLLMRQKGIQILLYLILLSLPVLLALFQALPTIELFRYSTRNIYTLSQVDKLLNPIWYFITVFIPDFFGNPGVRNYWFDGTYIERVSYFGAIPLLLALTAAFCLRKHFETAFFVVLAATAVFLSTNFGFTKFFYLIPIPMISTTVPTRILNLFEFSGSVLAAYGLQYLIDGKQKKQFIIAASIGFLLVAGSWGFVFAAPKLLHQTQLTVDVTITRRNLYLPTFFVCAFILLTALRFYRSGLYLSFIPRSSANRKKMRIVVLNGILLFVFSITLFDLFYFFHKITPFSPKEFIYPQTEIMTYIQKNAGINRFWGYGSAYISSNFQTLDQTFSPEGDDPLHLKLYSALISASKNGKPEAELSRLDANIASGYGPTDLQNNFYRQKILNLFGVKYIVYKNDLAGTFFTPDTATFPQNSYKLVWQRSPWQIYENLRAAPRVFFTKTYQVMPDKTQEIIMMMHRDFHEQNQIIVNEDPHIAPGSPLQSVVQVADYQPNHIVLQTQSNSDALLFLSDNYMPGWRASIDGQSVKIYRADYSFRAVKVIKGNHAIDFWYYPQSFDWGWKLSGVIFVGLIIGVYIIRKGVFFDL